MNTLRKSWRPSPLAETGRYSRLASAWRVWRRAVGWHGTRPSLAVGAVTALCALLASCGPPVPGSEDDPFRDFYQVNLMDAWEIPALDAWTETLVGPGSNTPAGGGHSYILASPTAEGFRLEIPNLLPDGDFEATGLDPDWTTSAGITTEDADSTDANGISGESLRLQGSGFASFTLQSGLSDQFVSGGLYEVRLRYNRNTDSVLSNFFDYADGVESLFGGGPFQDANPPGEPTPWTVYSLPSSADFAGTSLPSFRMASEGSATATFVLGSPEEEGEPMNSYFDDIRVIRTDIFPLLATSVDLSAIAADAPPAYPGEYVLVLDAIPAETSPTVPNSFPAEYLSAWSSTGDGAPLSGWETDTRILADIEGYGATPTPLVFRLDFADIAIGPDGPEGTIQIALSPDTREATDLMPRGLGAIELRNPRLFLDAWGGQITDADFATWD